jgi:hypothetical protein
MYVRRFRRENAEKYVNIIVISNICHENSMISEHRILSGHYVFLVVRLLLRKIRSWCDCAGRIGGFFTESLPNVQVESVVLMMVNRTRFFTEEMAVMWWKCERRNNVKEEAKNWLLMPRCQMKRIDKMLRMSCTFKYNRILVNHDSVMIQVLRILS